METDEFSLASVQEEIKKLQSQIDQTLPVGNCLFKIHSDLFKKPELLMSLADSEIAVLIKGIETHTRRELLVGKEKPKIKKKYTMDDFSL